MASQGVQAWDRYAYSNNSPIVHSDPSGHCIDGVTTIFCIAIGVGAVVGSAVSVYNLYQNNDQVSTGQVVDAAIGGALTGAVIGGGLVIAGTAAVIGVSVLSGLCAAACADGDCTNEGISLARSLGQAGEKASGIIKNNTRIESATGTASYRIPDQLIPEEKIISEVKNVSQLSLTNQIKDFIAYAQEQGYTFELWVRESTRLSKPLQDAIDNSHATLKYLEPK